MTHVLTMLSIHSTYNSPICSLEGLKLETSALNFSCGGKDKGLYYLQLQESQEGAVCHLTA